MMDSCLVSKWLRFNSTREAHIHTCSWHREREREGEIANASNIKALGLQRNYCKSSLHMTAQFELPCWTKSHPRKSSWSFWKTGYRNLTRSRCICCMNQSFWYVHFGTSPLLDSSAVSSFRNQPASKYHFTAWPACLCMLVLTHKAVSIPGLLVMPWPHDDMRHGLNRSCYKLTVLQDAYPAESREPDSWQNQHRQCYQYHWNNSKPSKSQRTPLLSNGHKTLKKKLSNLASRVPNHWIIGPFDKRNAPAPQRLPEFDRLDHGTWSPSMPPYTHGHSACFPWFSQKFSCVDGVRNCSIFFNGST